MRDGDTIFVNGNLLEQFFERVYPKITKKFILVSHNSTRMVPGPLVHYLDDEKLLYYRIHSGNTLSEAAIIGREQDKDLIRKYMLEAIPEEFRRYAAAGSDRFVELEQELAEVRLTFEGSRSPGIKSLLRQLTIAVKQKLLQ